MDMIVNLWVQGGKIFEELKDSACQEVGWLVIQSVIWLNAIQM
jgi:hypothetical protein